jgi:hypothetical protein
MPRLSVSLFAQLSLASLTRDGINGFNSVFLAGHKPMKTKMTLSARSLFEKQSFVIGRATPAAARQRRKARHRDPKSVGFAHYRIGRKGRPTFQYENSIRLIDSMLRNGII